MNRYKTIAVLYYSCTGNTKYLAEVIRRTIEGLTDKFTGKSWNDSQIKVSLFDMVPMCKKIARATQGGEPINDEMYPIADGYIFGSSIYCYRIPNILCELIKSIPKYKIQGKPVYCFTSHSGSSGYAVRQIEKLLVKKRGLYAGYSEVYSPSSWVPGPGNAPYNKWDKSDINQFENEVKRIPGCFHDIEKKRRTLVGLKWSDFFIYSKLVSDSVVGYYFKPVIWNSETCNECKLCVDRCPTNALEFEKITVDEKTIVRLAVDNQKCFGCTMCINNCPKRAIDSAKSRNIEGFYSFYKKTTK